MLGPGYLPLFSSAGVLLFYIRCAYGTLLQFVFLLIYSSIFAVSHLHFSSAELSALYWLLPTFYFVSLFCGAHTVFFFRSCSCQSCYHAILIFSCRLLWAVTVSFASSHQIASRWSWLTPGYIRRLMLAQRAGAHSLIFHSNIFKKFNLFSLFSWH